MTRLISSPNRRILRDTTCLPLLALCGIMISPAFGQQVPEQLTEPATNGEAIVLDPIVLEALRQSQPVAAVPNAVTIIDEQNLDDELAVAGDMSTILGNMVPGYSPSRQKLTNSGEALRGRSPLYLVDGVPQSNPLRDSSRDGQTIDPDLLERVEVVNGSSSIQGMGALGGIINLQTRDLAKSETWEGLYRLRVTAPDNMEKEGFSYKGVYMAGRKYGDLDVTFGITAEKSGIYYDGADNIVGLDWSQGDMADSLSRDFFLKAGYAFGDDQRLQLMVNDYRSRGDGDYKAVIGDRETNRYASATKGRPEGDTPANDVTTVSLDYTDDDLYGGQLRAQLFYQDFSALFGGGQLERFQDPAIAPIGELFDQSQNNSRKRGLKLTYGHSNLGIPGFSAVVGLDVLRDDSRQTLAQTGRVWVPEMEYTNWAPFVHFDQELLDGRLTLSGGLRYENARLDVDDYTTLYTAGGGVRVKGGSPEFSEVLPDLGATFKLSDSLTAYASYSQGFTMPDVGRVLRGIGESGQDVDDLIKLEPVIADNREIGVDYNDGRLSLHAAYFWSDSDLGERIEEINGLYFTTRERTEIEGFELSAAYDMSDSLRIGGLYSRPRGRYDSDGDDSVDTDLGGNNMSPDRLNLFAEWNGTAELPKIGTTPLTGRVQASHFFDRDFDGPAAPEGQDFDGHTLVSLSLGAQTQIGDFTLGIDNLLDEEYVTYYSQTVTTKDDRFFAGRGRTFTMTYENRF